MSIELVIPSNHLLLCYHLLLPPSIFPSIRVFPNESILHIRWPKYWSFSCSISLSSEYSGLISLRMDWFDHLAVQGTIKSLFQHHGSKASILWCSGHIFPYMTTGKTKALMRRTFVGKVMSLLFNILSIFFIAFLPRSKCLNFMAAVTICSDFGAQENLQWFFEPKSHCFHSFPIYLPRSDGTICLILVFWMLSFNVCWVLSQVFHSPLSLSSRGSLILLHFLP